MNDDPAKLVEDYRWILPPGEPSSSWWIWLLTGLLVIAVVGGFLLIRRRKIAQPSLWVIAPHEKALKAVQELSLCMKEEADLEFAKEISRIIREYIQDRFDLRAPHRSTEEFLQEASTSTQLSAHDQSLLRDFLQECDKVKFARQRIGLARMNSLLTAGEKFIRETIPATAPEPEST